MHRTGTMHQHLIKANHVSVIRQGKPVLNHINLAIDEGSFTTIIGPNGAGKSMLLKCLMGFYPPDRGTVVRKKALRTGYVPQRLYANQTMPISAQRFLTLRKKTDHRTLQKIVEEIGIQHMMQQPLAMLSGGELQSVLLARSLLNNPELLILDEPAQNLDIGGQLSFYNLIERIYQERGLSVLMVSHDLHMVMASSRQVICLFHHICCSGAPQTIARDPEFIALFGHDMANMMAVYQHSHDVGHQHSHPHNRTHTCADHSTHGADRA